MTKAIFTTLHAETSKGGSAAMLFRRREKRNHLLRKWTHNRGRSELTFELARTGRCGTVFAMTDALSDYCAFMIPKDCVSLACFKCKKEC